MRRVIDLVLTVFASAFLLAAACRCADVWYHGGSPDPRCVYGWRGYVEVHKLDPKRNSVLCQYRPEVGAP